MADPKSGELLCIVWGPKHVYAREQEERWCFGCRKRLIHEWRLMGDPPDVETYYEPIWVCRCTRCGQDRTRFPVRAW